MKGFITLLLILLSPVVSTRTFAQHIVAIPQVQQQITKEKDTTTVSVIMINNRLRVENAPVGGKLEIYSVVGIKVAEIEMKQAYGEYSVDIAKGYYIVRIGDAVCKIAIR